MILHFEVHVFHDRQKFYKVDKIRDYSFFKTIEVLWYSITYNNSNINSALLKPCPTLIKHIIKQSDIQTGITKGTLYQELRHIPLPLPLLGKIIEP